MVRDSSCREYEMPRLILMLIGLLLPVPAHLAAGDLYGVAFSHDSSFLVTGGKNSLHVLETDGFKQVQTIRFPSRQQVWDVAFSPSARDLFAAGCGDGRIRLWQVGMDEPVRVLEGHDGLVIDVAFQGRLLASVSQTYIRQIGRPTVAELKLWNVETGELLQELSLEWHVIRDVAFSEDGKRLAYCVNWHRAKPSTVEVRSIDNWDHVVSIPFASKLARTPVNKPIGHELSFIDKDRGLVVAGGICRIEDGKRGCVPTGLLWHMDPNDPKSAKPIGEPVAGYHFSAGRSKDGQRYVVAASEVIELRDAKTGELHWKRPINRVRRTYGAMFSPDDQFVTFIDEETLHILDANTGKSVDVIAFAAAD